MFTHAELLAIHRSLRTTRVLSLYVDFTATDPAVQRTWRVQLERSLSDLERRMADAPHDERVEFARCIELANETLAKLDPGIGSPGWAAFVTAENVRGAHALPVPVQTLAIWSTGPYIAPYVRALKETRPVVLVLADARKATIYQYLAGRAVHIDNIRAHHVVEHADHMGTPSRVGFHAGTRGRPGRDAAQRALLNGRDRMIATVVDRVVERAGNEGWIALGGVKRVVAALARHLEPIAPDRVLELTSLDVHSSDAEVVAAARAAASTLRNAADSRRLAELADEHRPGGLAAFGARETERALMDRCVQDLYITRTFRDAYPAEADAAIRMALDQDAAVEETSGSAAELLDEHGGIAAGLRFQPAGALHVAPG